MQYTTVLFIFTLAFSLSGCSFLFVDGPPDEEMWRHVNNSDLALVDCDSWVHWPLVDTLMGSLSLVRLSNTDNLGSSKDGVFIIGLLDLALWTSSAIVGYMDTADCREFERYRKERLPPSLPNPLEHNDIEY